MQRHILRGFAFTFITVALGIAGISCSSSTSPPPPNTVYMTGSQFDPPTLTVQKGTKVTWQNKDSYTHTTTSYDGSWDSGDVQGGGSTFVTFNKTGTFTYYCRYHKNMGMTGTVIVQ